MTETAAEAMKRLDTARDEREMNQRVKWFIDKWCERMDASREEASEFSADFVMVVQSVHRDASRETHDLLYKALSALPPPPIYVKGTPTLGT